jgi:Zn-dependent protease with chaperone function
MTVYRNPRLPEGVNNSETRPLRDFLWLSGGVIGGLAALMVLLGLAASWIAGRIPFEYERGVAEPLVASLVESGEAGWPDAEQDGAAERIRAYLQGLADRLAPAMDLPQGMSVTVHYSGEDTVNAFATLGGHLLVYRGLMETLPHENALAMVMGHEIAHVLHRDPIVSLGRGVVVATAMGALAGVSSSDIATGVIGQTGLLTQMHFSRDQERDADRAGMAALAAVYGHANGALDLFTALARAEAAHGGSGGLEFFQTHPATPKRIAALRDLAAERGWPLTGETTPYPDWLAPALEATAPAGESRSTPPPEAAATAPRPAP